MGLEQLARSDRILKWKVDPAMPYCTQCGNEVGTVDRFCARCGKVQSAGTASAGAPPPPPPGPGQEYYYQRGNPIAQMSAVDGRTASLLCYVPIVGWIMSIVVLASVKYRDDLETRFHAFQGLYLFVAWLVTDWVLAPIVSSPSRILLGFHIGGLLKAVLIGAWIFMLVKVSQRERFKLPIIGDLAEKSVSEQRV